MPCNKVSLRMVVLLLILLTACGALKFSASPLNLYLQDCLSKKQSLPNLFLSAKPISFRQLGRLLSIKTIPIDDRILKALDSVQYDEQIGLQEVLSSFELRGPALENLDLIYDLNPDLTQADVHEKLSRAKFYPRNSRMLLVKGTWQDQLEALSTSPELLSTRRFCSILGGVRGLVNEFDIWHLIDGDCIMAGRSIDGWRFLMRSLLGPDNRPNFTEYNGLGPLLRVQQLLVSVLSVHASASSGKDQEMAVHMRRYALGAFYEFNLAMAYTKRIPVFQEQPEVHRLYNDLFHLLGSQVKLPERLFEGREALVKLISFLKSLPTDLVYCKGIINSLVLMLRCSEADLDEITVEIKALLMKPSWLILKRQLYVLFIFLLQYPGVTTEHEAVNLVWRYLAPDQNSARALLKTNWRHFGLLCPLAMRDYPSITHEYFRYDVLLSLKAAEVRSLHLLGNPIASSIQSIKDRLNHMSVTEFLQIGTDKETGRRVLIPKIELHPFIEHVWWSLLKLAIINKIDLDFVLDERYLMRIFGKPAAMKSITNHLIMAIVEHQFFGDSSIDTEESVFKLDVLQQYQMVWGQHSTAQSASTDYKRYLMDCGLERLLSGTPISSKWRDLSLKNEQLALKGDLMMLGRSVWAERPRMPTPISTLLLLVDSYHARNLLFPTTK